MSGVERLSNVCAGEGVKFEKAEDKMDVLAVLMNRCDGDLRRAVTLLQGAHRLGKPLSVSLIDSLAGTVPLDVINSSLSLLTSPSTTPTNIRSFVLETFSRSALPPSQFLNQLIPHLMTTPTALPSASSLQTSLVLEKAAGSEARIGEGADETIQILDFFMTMRMILYPREFKQTISLL